jgi:hypothetical protein
MTQLLLYILRAVSIIQTGFIPKYRRLQTTYKLDQHVSASICSHLQGAHTKVMFSYKYIFYNVIYFN